jgi:hypothetical protein
MTHLTTLDTFGRLGSARNVRFLTIRSPSLSAIWMYGIGQILLIPQRDSIGILVFAHSNDFVVPFNDLVAS